MRLNHHRLRLAALSASVLLGSACQGYPECKAFEFGDFESEPRVEDQDADFDDCGSVRAVGMKAAPMIDDPSALDCALDGFAEGRATRLAIEWEPDGADGITATLWSDADGLTMRWRDISVDLNLQWEAKLYQLDPGRVAECREDSDAGLRLLCLEAAFDTAEVVETCGTQSRVSI